MRKLAKVNKSIDIVKYSHEYSIRYKSDDFSFDDISNLVLFWKFWPRIPFELFAWERDLSVFKTNYFNLHLVSDLSKSIDIIYVSVSNFWDVNKTFNSTSDSHEKSVWRDSWNNSIKYLSNFKFSKNLFSFFFESFSFRKDDSSVFFIDIDHSYLDFLSDKFEKFIKDSFLISIFYSRVVDRSKLRQWDESLDTMHIDQKSSKVCLSRNNSDDFILFELCNNWLPYIVLEESSYWNDVVSIFVSYSWIDDLKLKFCRWVKIKLWSF